MTAAIVDASCRAIILSNSSAKCAPHSGKPFEKAMSFRECVCGKWSTNGREAPEKAFLFGPIPPTLIPGHIQHKGKRHLEGVHKVN